MKRSRLSRNGSVAKKVRRLSYTLVEEYNILRFIPVHEGRTLESLRNELRKHGYYFSNYSLKKILDDYGERGFLKGTSIPFRREKAVAFAGYYTYRLGYKRTKEGLEYTRELQRIVTKKG